LAGLPNHANLGIPLGINLLNNQQIAIKFEPRKSDAPQLRDEYRAYKILAGSGTRLVFLLPANPHIQYISSSHSPPPLHF
jgi:hypothetical protein